MNLNSKFIGKILDKRYKINKIIGVGGMSIVFEAYDAVAGRTVAVKVLKQEMANDEHAVRRFINESRTVSMLSHPNIVKIYDVSVKSQMKYIVMERIEGITLKSYMERKGILSVNEMLSYTEQILSALSYAHSMGVVHRDIKPQNILLLKSGRLKVSDFGIATIENLDEQEKKAVGTVYYISPEQASGKRIDGRSDIYSVGVMMYEMATGKLPFVAKTPVEIARKHMTVEPRHPREINPSLPFGIEQVILSAMEKNPDNRFSSAEEMGNYISRLRTNPSRVFKTRKKNTTTIAPENSAEMTRAASAKKKKKKESRTIFPVICGVAAGFLIVFSVAAFYLVDLILKAENNNSPVTVEVPTVVNQLYDDELKKQFDSSIYKVVVESKYDSSYPENTIIKQEPTGGSKRKVLKYKQYCTVTLTVSKGSRIVSLPDLTITEYRAAQLRLERMGLKVSLQEVFSDTVEVGYIVSTDPAAGTQVNAGTTVTLFYSKGQNVSTYKVPALTNMTPKQAYSKMSGNFAVGQVSYEYSSSVAEGKIISQSVPSGTQVVKGTKIDFVISLGPEPVVTTEPQETAETP